MAEPVAGSSPGLLYSPFSLQEAAQSLGLTPDGQRKVSGRHAELCIVDRDADIPLFARDFL